jgi:Fe-S oxidoreductase
MPDLDTSISYCTFCPKLCRHVCPVSHVEAKETLVPQHKMATYGRLRRGESDHPELESALLYACTHCGACTEACLHKIEVGPALVTGRAEREMHGRGPAALQGFHERFRQRADAAHEKVRASVPADKRPAEAQVAFLPGCEAPADAERMLELAARLEADYVAIADVPSGCAGYPLWAAGLHDDLRLWAERFAQQVAGYARLVVHCPMCVWTLRTRYPQLGVPLAPRIESTAEFLEGFAERLPIVRRREAAHYHDPCYLGRHLAQYDPPRRLLRKAVTELVEFSRNREHATCSGGGALLAETMPETAAAIAEERLAEARASAHQTVVTACPTCKHRLGGQDEVEVVDLLELLCEATAPAQPEDE